MTPKKRIPVLVGDLAWSLVSNHIIKRHVPLEIWSFANGVIDFVKGYSSQSGLKLETHKGFCRFFFCVGANPTKWILLGSWYTIQTSHHPSDVGSQASRQRFEKGRRQIATFKYPKPQTRNLSYNHWFYTALRSCFRGGNTQTPEGMFNTFVVYMLSPKISLNDPKNERSPLAPPN